MSDVVEIEQLVLQERLARDLCLWNMMRDV